MAREEIRELIERAAKNLYKKEIEIKVERPAEATHRDYVTNIAMILKKILRKLLTP